MSHEQALPEIPGLPARWLARQRRPAMKPARSRKRGAFLGLAEGRVRTLHLARKVSERNCKI